MKKIVHKIAVFFEVYAQLQNPKTPKPQNPKEKISFANGEMI